MKYFIYVLNCLLVVLIPTTFILKPTDYKNENNIIKTEVKVKKLQSGLLVKETKTEEPKKEKQNSKVEEKEAIKEEKETPTIEKEIKEEKEVKKEQPIKVEKEQKKVTTQQPKVTTDVLETRIGKMSGYGANCKGCSGYLASGKYVGDGDIYYNDSKYGRIRIVAGDKIYKFGTIVRIKNSRAGDNIIAIVLDRGGSIGLDKKFMFDLLYKTENDALKDEVSYNTTFEILRYGY
ncbi:MAG: hypothetical protein E7160_01685 [Firmicutes bacterium]|nr:hypothetical protein [Bacillota bacterium]